MHRVVPQLRIHVPVEFGVAVLPPSWRKHVTYGVGTGLELRWSEPHELRRRIAQADWPALLEPTYNHDCSTLAWDLWALGSLFLLSGSHTRLNDWATIDVALSQAAFPPHYCKRALLVLEGLKSARADRFRNAPTANDCAGTGAAALALVIVNHVNLGKRANDPQAVAQLKWLQTLTHAVGRKALRDELEAYWRQGVVAERVSITRELERLSSRA